MSRTKRGRWRRRGQRKAATNPIFDMGLLPKRYATRERRVCYRRAADTLKASLARAVVRALIGRALQVWGGAPSLDNGLAKSEAGRVGVSCPHQPPEKERPALNRSGGWFS